LKTFLDSGKNREEYDFELAKKVDEIQPNLVILAGWMLILSPKFLDKVSCEVINLHPALPGQFAGTNAIERAFQAFQKGEITHTGVMIHKVVPEIDAGETILTLQVPINKNDSLEDLEQRMHETEHKIIVEAIKKILS